MANYQAAPPATPPDFPGKTLGVVGLVLGIVVPLAGIVVSAIALNQSKSAGYPNKLAKIGLIIGIVLTALYIILWVGLILLAAAVPQPG